MNRSPTTAAPENFEIWLASPRGFCAGVERAINIVQEALKRYGPPIYVKHQIVHNPHVVNQLSEEGAIFVEHVEEIPPNSRVIFSAHGIAPKVREDAKVRGLESIDATCPLVTKVHKEAVRYAREDYTIILIGHLNHVEVVGTLGHAPKHIMVVGSAEEAELVEVPAGRPVAYITQTTLSVDDTKEIIEVLKRRFPSIAAPPKGDICYATTNRQNAVKALAEKVKLMIIVGSSNSSNTLRLVEVARRSGCEALRIESPYELDMEIVKRFRKVGITAGASAPEYVVGEIVEMLRETMGGKAFELKITEENTFFPLPYALRKPAEKESPSRT